MTKVAAVWRCCGRKGEVSTISNPSNFDGSPMIIHQDANDVGAIVDQHELTEEGQSEVRILLVPICVYIYVVKCT